MPRLGSSARYSAGFPPWGVEVQPRWNSVAKAGRMSRAEVGTAATKMQAKAKVIRNLRFIPRRCRVPGRLSRCELG